MIRVAYPFVGNTMGGAWHSTFTLIKNLPREIKPKIYLHQTGLLSNYLDSHNIEYTLVPNIKVNFSNNLFHQINSIFHNKKILKHVLKKDKIDIVHSNDFKNHLSWLIPAKLCGYKTIW